MRSSARGAALVGIGIFFSRIAGFIRESLFAHYFGNGDVADAFKAALRIPNFLQNLLGEGVLGASFIPVYSRLLHSEEERGDGPIKSSEFAYAVGILLLGVVAIISALGVLFSPTLVDLITPGFEGEKRELTIRLVRILFPATAALVLSAWCLGVLNSHRRFLLSYLSPVMWNGTIILVVLCFVSGRTEEQGIVWVTWGVLLGGLAQWLVQMPLVFRIIGSIRLQIAGHRESLTQVSRAFFPTLLGRGVVQVSAFVDSMFASLLATGALSALTYAQMIYLMPISLFAVPFSAAELPELSRGSGGTLDGARLRERINTGVRRIAFFIIPTLFLFLFFGSALIRALYESGSFTGKDTLLVSATLGGMAVGLLPSSFGRMYASMLYALGKPRLVVRASVLRVIFGTAIGGVAALKLPELLGLDPEFGVIFLVAGSGLASWLEFAFLFRSVERALPGESLERSSRLLQLLGIAAVASLAALGVQQLGLIEGRIVELMPILGCFGLCYLGGCVVFGVPEVELVTKRLRRFAL